MLSLVVDITQNRDVRSDTYSNAISGRTQNRDEGSDITQNRDIRSDTYSYAISGRGYYTK